MRRVLLTVAVVLMYANGAFAWNGSNDTATSANYKRHSGPNTSVGKKVDTSLGDIMLAEKYRYTRISSTDSRRQQRERK